MRARETCSWRSSSVRTAIMSIFKSLRTWVLMNLWSLSSSSLNLLNPDMTKSASLPMSFFPFQRGPLGLPSWYCRKHNAVLNELNSTKVNDVEETSFMGLILLVNSPSSNEAKSRIFQFFKKERLAITHSHYTNKALFGLRRDIPNSSIRREANQITQTKALFGRERRVAT